MLASERTRLSFIEDFCTSKPSDTEDEKLWLGEIREIVGDLHEEGKQDVLFQRLLARPFSTRTYAMLQALFAMRVFPSSDAIFQALFDVLRTSAGTTTADTYNYAAGPLLNTLCVFYKRPPESAEQRDTQDEESARIRAALDALAPSVRVTVPITVAAAPVPTMARLLAAVGTHRYAEPSVMGTLNGGGGSAAAAKPSSKRK